MSRWINDEQIRFHGDETLCGVTEGVVEKTMEKDALRINNSGIGNSTNYSRDRNGGAGDGGLLRSSSDPAKQTASSSDFVLQWGNRKRLRCMKIQVKDDQSGPVNRTTVRVDRRVVRADKDSSNQPSNNNHGNGYFNLRQRPASPQAPPSQRVLRYCVIYDFTLLLLECWARLRYAHL
ncbi:hypothetical protein Gohar_014528 [Gossypium harknessii]|uniref:Uncharacterized protein n=3 Tax=Gossypium TaxID=3633 RepID=A0A7J9FY28_9ROSI|nr:hypothetical protein [Gossypium harknessii]